MIATTKPTNARCDGSTWLSPNVCFRPVADIQASCQSQSMLAAGTMVRYDGGEAPEYGVVVHCWHNPEIDALDCYVAFFGSEPPTGIPAEKPYILRYAAASLTVLG